MMRRDRQPRRVWSAAIAHTIARPVIAVVMGVAGSGKTTVAALLAAALGCQFQEGDDLHPAANVEKMHGGTPLTDADRLPWLRKIAEEIDSWRARGESGVLTCSALKRSYRDIIIGDSPGVTLVYLKGSYDLIRRRTTARHEHFMPVALLDSQFASCRTTLAAAQPRSPPRSCIGWRSGKVAVAAMNLHREWRRPRKPRQPRQESDNDTPGKRNSQLAFRG